MAIALVRAGAIAQSVTTSVTPAFGQATTAGNLLICRVIAPWSTAVTGSDLAITAGWSLAVGDGSPATTPSIVALFYKSNCAAGESAPTVTATGYTLTSFGMAADLLEVSGAATASPVDKTGVEAGATTALAASATDVAARQIAVAVFYLGNSKTATCTFTDVWTPAGGTTVAAQGTGATKDTRFMWGSAYITTANTTPDQNAMTQVPSTGAAASRNGAIATFNLPAASTPSLVFSDRPIRRNSLLRR